MQVFLGIALVLASSFASVVAADPEDCLVETSTGKLSGRLSVSRGGQKFCSYLGIPYAEAAQRFQESRMKDKWEGTLNATKLGAMCPQLSGTDVVGEEDCLFLNVFVPIQDQCKGYDNMRGGMPVFVHIHGGSYTMNSGGVRGPIYLMNDCIVYVTMNYRLGALGFLTTEDGLIPGNLALKDQRLSLQWVHQNIGNFGGNKGQVTIDGISAGSCSVSHQVASLSSKGLFRRAISQSGSSLNAWGISKEPGMRARILGQRVKCTSNGGRSEISTEALKACLLAVDFKDIVNSQENIVPGDPSVIFGPVVEVEDTATAFHTMHPYEKYQLGQINMVPMMIGFTEDEGYVLESLAILMNKTVMDSLNNNWDEIAPTHLMYYYDYIPNEKKKEFSKKIRDFYFGDKLISEETLQNLTNLNSDRFFVQGIFELIQAHSFYATVYPYVMSYKGDFSFAQYFGYKKKVITHADDGQYLFNIPGVPELKPDTADYEFSHRLIKLWMSFAITGKPTETWPKRNVWAPYSSYKHGPWIRIDSNVTTEPNYLAERRQFWKELGLRPYDYPTATE